MQATEMVPPEVLSQNLQALTQILDAQQQMMDWQLDWLRHSRAMFKMPQMIWRCILRPFEHYAIMTRLDKRYWASQLSALVMGKAQVAYQGQKMKGGWDEARDYKWVKAVILYRLKINPEHYRMLFQAKKGPDERQPRILLQLL